MCLSSGASPLTRADLDRPESPGLYLQQFAGEPHGLPRKEVIQPHFPVRLPCYDFVPITDLAFGGSSPTSGAPGFRDVTGGVYKARERIHRGVLTRGY